MVSKLPKMMKAAVIDKAGPPSAIRIASVPVPRLARGHVIIALDYASVGSWDAKIRSGAWGPIKRGTVLGADGSGTVAAVSSDVKRLRVGQRVYAYSYGQRSGFYAEYVSVPADRVERVPTHLNQQVAGAMPCVAVTAHSGLRALKTKRGKTVLVFGASGGVGSLAVWLGARAMGATVIGTARPDAHAYLRTLGAAHAIDPHSPQSEAAIKRVAPKGLDALLATANGQGLPVFAAHLRARAPIAYPNGVEPEIHIDGHASVPFDGNMSLKNLQLLNKAIGKRAMPLRVEVFPLDKVVDAHRRMDQGHVVGKIVLRIRR
jgi:NADPH:quinone reductase-like Zn-dependent oxidoreductase